MEGGFRADVNFPLRRGQVVELILDEDSLSAVRCTVVWIGKPGTKPQGEAGLEIVQVISSPALPERDIFPAADPHTPGGFVWM
jgi:hypothetical protein